MGKVLEGKQDGEGLRVSIAASRFNSLIAERLLEGAIEGAGTKAGNKGAQAADSLIERVNVLREIQ